MFGLTSDIPYSCSNVWQNCTSIKSAFSNSRADITGCVRKNWGKHSKPLSLSLQRDCHIRMKWTSHCTKAVNFWVLLCLGVGSRQVHIVLNIIEQVYHRSIFPNFWLLWLSLTSLCFSGLHVPVECIHHMYWKNSPANFHFNSWLLKKVKEWSNWTK